MKFVDGLANVASNRPRRPKWACASSSFRSNSAIRAHDADPELDCTDSADPYDLLAKVLAVQHRSVVNRPGRVVEEDVGSANDRIKRAVSVLRRAEIA